MNSKIKVLSSGFLILMICSSWGSVVHAETKTLQLSLSDALELFRRQNLRLISERFQMETSKADLITAGLFPNPQLAVNQTFMEFGNSGTGQFSARLDALIETGGKRKFRMEGAKAGIRAAEERFYDITRQLLIETKNTYYDIVLARQHHQLAEDNLARFDQILRINAIRFEKGAISEAEFIKTRLQKLDFQNEAAAANLEVLTAKNHLKGLLSLPPSQDVEITGEFGLLPALPPLNTLQEQALQRPDFLAQEAQILLNQFQLKSAWAQRIPDLTFGAEYDSSAPDYHPAAGGGISLSIPFFNRNQGEIRKAELLLEASQTQMDQLRREIELEVEQAYYQTIENLGLVKVFETGMIKDAQEALEIAENGYRKGGTTLLDLLEAERTFKITRFNYHQALSNAQKGFISLEGAVGKEFSP